MCEEAAYGCSSLNFDDSVRVIHEIRKEERMAQEALDNSNMEAQFVVEGESGSGRGSMPPSKPEAVPMQDQRSGSGTGTDSSSSSGNFWKDTVEGQTKAGELPPNPPKQKNPAAGTR